MVVQRVVVVAAATGRRGRCCGDGKPLSDMNMSNGARGRIERIDGSSGERHGITTNWLSSACLPRTVSASRGTQPSVAGCVVDAGGRRQCRGRGKREPQGD